MIAQEIYFIVVIDLAFDGLFKTDNRAALEYVR